MEALNEVYKTIPLSESGISLKGTDSTNKFLDTLI